MTTPNYSKWPIKKMDICDETSEKNAEYAFLLGSAIRNADADRFIDIYDAILPRDLTVKQVKVRYN